MSGLHKSKQEQQYEEEDEQPWYEGERHFGGTGSEPAGKASRRVGTLLPKLRRAFETATINSTSGSFPTGSPEETAFEACDSNSIQSVYSQSLADISCATGLSYNMSKIDDESIQEACDAAFSPHDASETDSFFGAPFRDMVSFGDFITEKKEPSDDVWLLSPSELCEQRIQGDRNNIYSRRLLTSPTGSILQRVPVVVLPVSSRSKSNDMKWNEDMEDEDEILFVDQNSVLPNIASASANNATSETGGFDDKHHGSLRNRAQIFGSNIREIWNKRDGRKKGKEKVFSRRSQHSKRNQPSSRPPIQSQDPSKELSSCHDKMAQQQITFSPAKAFSKKIRGRKRRGEFLPDMDDGTGYALDYISSKDEESAESTIARNDHLSSKASAAQDTTKQAALEEQNTEFKFKSPRNDTPRIIWGGKAPPEEEGEEEEEEEEPRVLYTDDGEIAAIIHPRPRRGRQHQDGGFPEDPDESVFHHLFHSELSTLYEETSSLEASTFATISHSRSSSLGETKNSKKQGLAAQASQENSHKPTVATISDPLSLTSKSKDTQSENQPPSPPLASNQACSSNLQQGTKHSLESEEKHESKCITSEKKVSYTDDSEIQMRWEFSLGMMDTSDQWRRPMALMNTEELSNDYVAEI